MNLSPPPLGFGCYPFLGGGSFAFDFLFIVTPIVAHSSFAIILMGKRELAALLTLSSWCLVMVVWLFLAVPWVCLRFVTVVYPDQTHYFCDV